MERHTHTGGGSQLRPEPEQRRLILRIGLAALLLIGAAASPLTGGCRCLAFLLPYALVGGDVLWEALRGLFTGNVFDETLLMSVATIGAMAIGEYAEGVAVMLFFQVGELLQDIAVGRSQRSITALMDLRPDRATVLRDGKALTTAPDRVAVGETVQVQPGERIPLDGIVLTGSTAIDASSLTGESLPRAASPGDEVYSGTVNLTGVITLRVTRPEVEGTAARILALVGSASAKKARSEAFITRFARMYTPCVVMGAALLAVLPPLILNGGWRLWLSRALVFLVVSCPCALVVSVPLTFFAGMGGASRQGILIKGAGYMEALAGARTVVFDKTGTLTRGCFTVTALHPAGIAPEALLSLAAGAEQHSGHPIARSIVAAWGKRCPAARQIREHPGLGVEAVLEGSTVLVGNRPLLIQAGVEAPLTESRGTAVYVARDGVFAGRLDIADTPKPGAAEAVAALHRLGVARTVMLTGDRADIARAVAEDLGLDAWRAELLPRDKVTALETLAETGSPIVFVGDGINDAPVLARADVGVAMGALGSDAAVEAADVVLMDDDPRRLARAVAVSRRTMGIARQNIVLALTVKALVLLLGALGLADMWIAVFADVGVTVLAILNAVRAMKMPHE